MSKHHLVERASGNGGGSDWNGGEDLQFLSSLSVMGTGQTLTRGLKSWLDAFLEDKSRMFEKKGEEKMPTQKFKPVGKEACRSDPSA